MMVDGKGVSSALSYKRLFIKSVKKDVNQLLEVYTTFI